MIFLVRLSINSSPPDVKQLRSHNVGHKEALKCLLSIKPNIRRNVHMTTPDAQFHAQPAFECLRRTLYKELREGRGHPPSPSLSNVESFKTHLT